MIKWVVLFLICFIASISPQTIISPQFSELKGMENQQGNTHLFYRVYEYISNEYGFYQGNSIYHFDLAYGIDTLFISDFINDYPAYQMFKVVEDYEFWNNDYSKFIYVGSEGGFKVFPYIRRFDEQYINLNYLCCSINNIDISNGDDSLLYAGGFIPWEGTIKSNDGGFHWNSLNDSLIFLSLNPYDNNILFLENSFGFLYRSTDAGNTFNLVDVLNQPSHSTSFIYDPDQQHIYRLFGNQTLRVSPNNGEPFSWQTKYSSDTKIFISNDESISGTIYVADKKNILVSTDYGNNFSLYKTLTRRIVGIYKKPNTNKLYAATKYKIYEITPDTIKIIKSLPIPEEVLKFYPLAVGNKWVFNHSTVTYDPYPNYFYQIDVKKVLGDTIAPNGKHYYLVNDQTLSESSLLERVDSVDGKVYRYYEDSTLTENEYVAYDLLAEVGDTLLSYRMGFNTVMFTTMYAEATFEKWGLTKPKKVFEEYTLHPPIFSITQDIGLDSIYSYFDFGETYITLKGCIIDGVIYGDTTTVGVEDDQKPVLSNFRLEQNYPNPFNPSTKIKFTIPSVIASGAKQSQLATLKVYDILGNEIATLINEELSPGEYEVTFDSHSGLSGIRDLPSGVYFYQLKSGSFVQTKKMVLLK